MCSVSWLGIRITLNAAEPSLRVLPAAFSTLPRRDLQLVLQALLFLFLANHTPSDLHSRQHPMYVCSSISAARLLLSFSSDSFRRATTFPMNKSESTCHYWPTLVQTFEFNMTDSKLWRQNRVWLLFYHDLNQPHEKISSVTVRLVLLQPLEERKGGLHRLIRMSFFDTKFRFFKKSDRTKNLSKKL